MTARLAVESRQMSDDLKERRQQLELRLQSVEENFQHELRARGFDPAQVETAALPTALANLYLQRESLRDDLENLSGEEN